MRPSARAASPSTTPVCSAVVVPVPMTRRGTASSIACRRAAASLIAGR